MKLRQVQLLSMEDEIAANTSVKDLAAFIRAAEVAAEPAAGPVARSGWFTVQFTLQPRARPIVKVVERDGIDDVTAQRIAAALSDVQPLYTRQAPVLFRAVFDVGGA